MFDGPVRWGSIPALNYDGPDLCVGDGQTEAEGVPSQRGRGDALLRRMPHTSDLTIF